MHFYHFSSPVSRLSPIALQLLSVSRATNLSFTVLTFSTIISNISLLKTIYKPCESQDSISFEKNNVYCVHTDKTKLQFAACTQQRHLLFNSCTEDKPLRPPSLTEPRARDIFVGRILIFTRFLFLVNLHCKLCISTNVATQPLS